MSGGGISLVAVHQRAAPLDERERAALSVAALPPRPDVLVLSSCHRVELYATAAAESEAAGLLGDVDPDHVIRLDGETAVRHLFRVASGLDSAVIGEGQIAGQLKRAHAAARERGLDPMIDRAVQRALAVARDVRSRGGLGAGRSVGSLAVDEAVSLVSAPHQSTALVIGAGEMGKLSARALARHVGRLVIANRDVTKAGSLAETVGARAVGLDALEAELASADILISAADTRGTVLTRVVLERRCHRGPLVVVDIAVPRSVAEDARDLPGLTYRDVDDLATERASVPPDAVAAAEQRCAEEARAFMDDLRSRAASETIRALRERADAVRLRQLGRALRKLEHLSARDRRVIEGLASSLVGSIVHEPTIALRTAPERAEAARALFDLDRPS